MFGFCITHILNTGCAKIWKKKVRRQKVKLNVKILWPEQLSTSDISQFLIAASI